MENRKQIYSAMRDWKRENCPPYSKLNKAELEALVQSLGIPIPAEEPAQARARAPAPKKKKIKPKFDKTPKKMIKPKKKKSKIKTAVEEAVKLGKKTIDEAPMRMIKPKKKKKNNLNLLQGLQGDIMGNIPLDLAPQAPDIPDEPRADRPMGRFDAPVMTPLDLAPQAPDIPDEPRADRPMGRFDAPVIKAPMGLQVQQANEIVLGDMDLDMDLVAVAQGENITITVRTEAGDDLIDANSFDLVLKTLRDNGYGSNITFMGEPVLPDDRFDDIGAEDGAVFIVEDNEADVIINMIKDGPNISRDSIINRQHNRTSFNPFNPPKEDDFGKIKDSRVQEFADVDAEEGDTPEEEEEVKKYYPIVLLDQEGDMKYYNNERAYEQKNRYRSYVYYVKIEGNEEMNDIVGIYMKGPERKTIKNPLNKPTFLTLLKNIKKGNYRGGLGYYTGPFLYVPATDLFDYEGEIPQKTKAKIEAKADADVKKFVDDLENVKVKPIEDFGDIPMRFPLEDENGEDIAFVWNSFPEVKLSIEGQRAYGKIFTQGSGVNMKAYVYISRGKRIFELLGELLAVPPAGGLGDDFIIYENDFRRFNDDVLYNMEGQKQDKPVSGKNKKIPQPILDEWERAMKENEGKYDLDFEVAKLMFKMKSGGGMTKQDIKTMADGLLDAMRDELKEAGGDDKKRREIELEYLVPIVELQRILTPEFNKVIKDVLKLRKDLEGEGVDINNLTKEIELGNLRPPPKQEEKKVKKGKSKTGLLVFKQKLYNKKQTNYYVDEFGNVYDDKDKKKYLGRFAKFGPSVIKKMIEDGSKAITYKAGDYTIDPKAEKRTSLEDPKPVAKPKSKKQKGPVMDIDEALLKGQYNKTAKSTIVNILKALDAKRRVLVLKSVINDNDTYDAIFEDAKTFDDYVEAMDEVEDEDTGQSFYEIFGEKIWTKARKNYTKL